MSVAPTDINHLERALPLLVTCNLHGINPYSYFVGVLQRTSSTKADEIADLTPIRWKELFAHQSLKSVLETR